MNTEQSLEESIVFDYMIRKHTLGVQVKVQCDRSDKRTDNVIRKQTLEEQVK